MTETTNTHFEHATSLIRPPQGASPEWLARLRASGAASFARTGFPSRRDEDWRYTSIAPIVETDFEPAPAAPFDRSLLAGREIDGALVAVIVNGRFDPAASRLGGLPPGVVVTSLADAIASGQPAAEAHLGRIAGAPVHAFAAINTASIADGVFVHVPQGAVLGRPLHIVTASQPAARPSFSHPRVLIALDAGAQATIVERFVGTDAGAYLCNAVTEFAVAEGAVVDHYKVQQESLDGFHVAAHHARLGRSSNFSSHSFGLGGRIARSDATAVLGGEGCEATLNGLFIAAGRQLMDSHTTLDHAMPNCPSHQLYKHILGGSSRGVFNGRIFVRLDAQKTDAKQTNQTLLLSRDAEINTKPQLEIFADDVRCTHGATVGQLSGEQLFYLRARGIGKEQAQDLLVYAFAGEVIQRVKVSDLRRELDQILLAERHIEEIA